MLTVNQIMDELQSKGSDSIKKILSKHGIKEPFFGVKIADMKPIQKQVKKDYQLAKDLYATGNNDAMYLAGLIADDAAMSKADLDVWVRQATSQNISEYTVPWVATGSKHAFEAALEWIDNPEEYIAAAGWATLRDVVSFAPDAQLDMEALKGLVDRVAQTIHSSQNRVVSTMNGFLISLGAYVNPLTDYVIAAANKIGQVYVNTDGTACKVPVAVEYIEKARARGSGKAKKKMVKC